MYHYMTCLSVSFSTCNILNIFNIIDEYIFFWICLFVCCLFFGKKSAGSDTSVLIQNHVFTSNIYNHCILSYR